MRAGKIVFSFMLIAFGLLHCLSGQAQDIQSERILHFHSRIQVHSDGGMTVTETIKVVCAGQEIKRGIFRTFPVTYQDRLGNTVKVGFHLLEVSRDGQKEPYHTKKAQNGIVIYIGNKDVYLDPGVYTYAITYHTDRQIGFFKDFDELYWNVTGNEWPFVIDRAEAVVELPTGAKILDQSAYTGPSGGRGKDYQTDYDDGGNQIFWTTRPLRPGEGLTIAVSWPKGLVAEPSSLDKIWYLLKDNAALVPMAGLIILFVYYLAAWTMVGKDLPQGTIIPLFSPPEDLSPAAIRFIMRMGFDDKAFVSAVINMAVKGYIIIKDAHNGFTLVKAGAGQDTLSSAEKKVAESLFGSRTEIRLVDKNHRVIGDAISALKQSLEKKFEGRYFKYNSGYFQHGFVLSLIILTFVVFKLGRDSWPLVIFLLAMIALLTHTLFFSDTSGVMVLKDLHKIKAKGLPRGFLLPLVPLFLIACDFLAMFFLGKITSPLISVIVAAIIFTDILFCFLLKAPSTSGRRIMDQIEGFKLYLSTAEKERLNVLNPPQKTPELFEKYLPYALALGVEQAWNEQFSAVLAAAGNGQDYSPAWYSGREWSRLEPSRFASHLSSSMNKAIASSSTPPGSSSGSGGSGSSGGGGGGGGGGGW